MIDKLCWHILLKDPSDYQVNEYILSQYEIMMDSYIRNRRLIPMESLVEVWYDPFTFNLIERIYISFLSEIYYYYYCCCSLANIALIKEKDSNIKFSAKFRPNVCILCMQKLEFSLFLPTFIGFNCQYCQTSIMIWKKTPPVQ